MKFTADGREHCQALAGALVHGASLPASNAEQGCAHIPRLLGAAPKGFGDQWLSAPRSACGSIAWGGRSFVSLRRRARAGLSPASLLNRSPKDPYPAPACNMSIAQTAADCKRKCCTRETQNSPVCKANGAWVILWMRRCHSQWTFQPRRGILFPFPSSFPFRGGVLPSRAPFPRRRARGAPSQRFRGRDSGRR